MYQIMILEDESCIASFIQKGLKTHRFTPKTSKNSGCEALAQAIGSKFDLLTLDINLPDADALKLTEALHDQSGDTPIIILTGRDDIKEMLSKATDENTPASTAGLHGKVLKVADMELNLHTRRAQVGNRIVDLPNREFNLAETFFRHPGQILSRAQLLNHVWGYDYSPESNIVDVYVGYLRKKLGKKRIETVRGMGYRLRTETVIAFAS